jgi:hypothetical protein
MSGSTDRGKFNYRLALEERKRAIRKLESLTSIAAVLGEEPDADVVIELTGCINGRTETRPTVGNALSF